MPIPPFENCIPTGNTIPVTYNYYQFRVPNADWIIEAALGQFLDLVNTYAFCKVGAVTVADAAEAFTTIYESIMQIFPIGSIVAYASQLPVTASILPCDGSSLLRADYTDLFAAIGTVWGAADIAHFNVPDLRGRTLINNGAGPGLSNRVPGDILGEETHQLTVAELASHSHSLQEFPLTGTSVPPPFDAADALPHFVNSTGATGGDQAHNNMQPSAVIVYGIVAG